MHESGEHCDDLIVATANTLNDEAVAMMLLALQRGNLEISIRVAVKR